MGIREEMAAVKERLRAYLGSSRYLDAVASQDLITAVTSYLTAGGKCLRPLLTMLCCRTLGGDEQLATPVSLATEVFHTWTLVHDDVIDRDATRRGAPTIHEEFRQRGEQLGLGEFAAHYGESVAILAGDVQHGWATCLIADLAQQDPARASLAVELIRDLEGGVLPRLIEGELLDVQLACRPIDGVTEADALRVIEGKTAALFSFACRAGAMCALGAGSAADPRVRALSGFGQRIGIAFQLQDDVLGIAGEEADLGKPVGSDIREAKRTLPLLRSWQNASPEQRQRLSTLVGRPGASDEQVGEARRLIEALGGLDYARDLAQHHRGQALSCLEVLGDSPEREQLTELATLLVERSR